MPRMMKNIFLFVLLLASQMLSAQTTKPSATLDLREAIQKKLVKVETVGLGGHSGESIKVACKSLTGKALRVRIPIGQLMYPADTTEQTLVVAQEQYVTAGPKVPVEVSLSTYCTESGQKSPSKAAPFQIGVMAPKAVCDLLLFVHEKGIKDEAAIQNAVWCITDKKPLGYIGNRELTKYTANLLGQSSPNYTIKSKAVEEVPGRMADLGKALTIEGNFQYYLAEDTKVLMNLLDSTGAVVYKVSKVELMKAGEHRSGINLQVWNLKPGKYTLRMQSVAGEVIKDMPVEF
jgi:hypothetical protein